MNVFQVLLLCFISVLSEDECEFKQLSYNTEYHAFTSLTKMNYAGPPADPSNYVGYQNQIVGANEDGTIFLLGGTYYSTQFGQAANTMMMKINVFDSFLSYDDTVDEDDADLIQSYWSVKFTEAVPAAVPLDWAHGYMCGDGDCSTYLNNILYVINPEIFTTSTWTGPNYPKLLRYDMNESVEAWMREEDYSSTLPSNYYASCLTGALAAKEACINGISDTDEFDTLSLAGDGCTTHNFTHVFHFNWAVEEAALPSSFPTTFIYDIAQDSWSLGAANPNEKFDFACAADTEGTHIYLFGGRESQNGGEASIETDRYDTHTGQWERLPQSADYPEYFGRYHARAVTDSTTNSILIFGGFAKTDGQTYSVRKVEIFRLDSADWLINSNPTDDLYLPNQASRTAVVLIDDFAPNGQNLNKSADTIFAFGGGTGATFNNYIQFVSVLTEREYYNDNDFIIQGHNPENAEIEEYAFDPWQRFELAFRIVVTDGYPVLLDQDWNITFQIDGVDIAEINEEYDTQLRTRTGCACEGRHCQNMPDNVQQVTIAQLLIPSHRTLHNGYCVNRTQEWIFSHNEPSVITLIAKNDEYTHEQDFTFNFMKIEPWTTNATKAEQKGLPIGCRITKDSQSAFEKFEIRCDGYKCEDCPEFSSIGRINRGAEDCGACLIQNEIEYNILMNDVLLAPDQYIKQHNFNDTIIGTQSLNTDSLIALVRARTALGTWYEECFYDFFVDFTNNWDPLETILESMTDEQLWADVIENLNSENNEDVIAAYSILVNMVEIDTVPTDADVQQEIANVLSNIMNDTTDTLDEITSNVALVDLLTSDATLVEAEIALEISTTWLPTVLNATIEILNNNSRDDDGMLAETVQKVGNIANSAATNLLNVSNFTEAERLTIVENVQEIMNVELTGTWEGEIIIHLREGSVTGGSIINKEETCVFGSISVSIPPNNAATNEDTIKCIITQTDNDETAIDLFDATGTRVFQTNSSCFPYFISMNVPSSYENAFEAAVAGEWYNTSGIEYPKCTFWNSSVSEWEGEGCIVYDMDADSVTCACTHLTTFKLSSETFDPKAQLLSVDDLRILSTENIQKHPTTWVTMLMIVVVLVVACICVPNNNADKPIIAFEDIIYKEFRDQYLHKHQQWHEIQQIDRWYTKIAHTKQEMGMAMDDDGSHAQPSLFLTHTTSSKNNKSRRKLTGFKGSKKKGKYYCLLSVNLFKTYVKNDHTVLSVFQRTDGTNFSTKQRIGLFLLYMYCIMMADAIFYGNQTGRKPMGDLTASALISLIGTIPVYIIRVLFQWSKPRIVKSAKSRKGSNAALFQTPLITTSDKMAVADEDMKDDEYLKKTGQMHDTDVKKRLSTTYWGSIAELKKASRPDMKLVRKCMHYVNTKANASEKASLASEIRLILFNYNYPFPHWYKKAAWTILVIVALICVLTAVIYGIQFDIKSAQMSAAGENDDYIRGQIAEIESSDECWNISHRLTAQSEVYTDEILHIQTEYERINDLNEPHDDDFFGCDGGNCGYDSTKWLLNVLGSFLMSVFVWQPLSIYLLTWIKIWAFNHGLIMEASVYNMVQFLCCCCMTAKKKNFHRNKSMMEFTSQKSVSNDGSVKPAHDTMHYVPEDSEMYELSVSGSSGFAVMGNEDRALDVIGFLCSDELFVDLPDDFESSYTK